MNSRYAALHKVCADHITTWRDIAAELTAIDHVNPAEGHAGSLIFAAREFAETNKVAEPCKAGRIMGGHEKTLIFITSRLHRGPATWIQPRNTWVQRKVGRT